MVIVICATNNQENYIRDAIESFLMQETDFPFEIIIHDDASTDNTPGIIKEYHSRYPEIIKPIIQKENQYSKGGFKPSVYAAEYSNGKYLALCEGDDYWINNNKLHVRRCQAPEWVSLFSSVFNATIKTDRAAGVMPSIREAWPKEVGRTVDSFSLSSLDNP